MFFSQLLTLASFIVGGCNFHWQPLKVRTKFSISRYPPEDFKLKTIAMS